MKKTVYPFIFLLIITVLLSLSLAADSNNSDNNLRERENSGVLRNLPLPVPVEQSEYSLEQTIKHNKEIADFTPESLSLNIISQLLWAAYPAEPNEKISEPLPQEPFKFYILIRGGVYVYNSSNHSLDKIMDDDIRKDIVLNKGKDKILKNAPCLVILTGSPEVLAKKYPSDAMKLLYFQAGQKSRSVELQALTLGLGSSSIDDFNSSKVRQLCKMSAGQEPLHLLAVGYPVRDQKVEMLKVGEALKPAEQEQPMTTKKQYKAVIVIPEEMFSDRELFDTRDALSIADVEVEIAGVRIDTFRGDERGIIDTTLLVRDIKVADYDAIVLVSGRRTRTLFKNTPLVSILREAAAQGKTIGAIGKATKILGEARIVQGYKVTGDNSARTSLRKAGATFTNAGAERSENLVTAQSQEYSVQFSRLLVEAITGKLSRQGGDGRYIEPRILEKRGQTRDEIRQDRTRRENTY